MAKKEKDIIKDTKSLLDKQDRRPIMVPVTESNEPLMVVINGVIYSIPRGELVEVPDSVFKVIQESLMGSVESKKDIKITELK